MKTLPKLVALLALPLLALPLGCASEGGPGGDGADSCRGDRCDDLDKPDSEVESFPCDNVMSDESGRDNRKLVGRLNDPLIKHALSGDDCPTTFADIMAKLRETDTNGCEGDEAGISTRAISETAQATGSPTSYRLVTTRKCDSRPTHGLIFSLFGVSAGSSSLPAGVEIIAFDESQGVFNFYEAERGGKINFFGNSKDLLKGAEGNVRRCAGCHTSGGLVMKELDTPWMHWEGHENTPGASDLVDKHSDLGSKSTGAEFEGVVKAGNRVWAKTKVTHLRENGTTQQLLKPLFCTQEVNIDNGADFGSPVEGGAGGTQISRIPFDSLLDPQLKGFGSITINFDDYDALIKANGQNVVGVDGAVDTFFDYAFLERSFIDNQYVDELETAGIVDDALVKDILMVDFTRPIFSSDRCDLLVHVPVLSADQLNPEALREGLIANLNGKTGAAEQELFNNLTNTELDHNAKVDAFTAACEALDKNDFLVNAMSVTSLNRSFGAVGRKSAPGVEPGTTFRMNVFEFPATFPTDNLNVPVGTRLDPTTCQLTTDFVAVSEPSANPPPPPPETEDNPCAHDVCSEGEKLDPTCDDAQVATICGADSFCCNNRWDNLCVGAATGCE